MNGQPRLAGRLIQLMPSIAGLGAGLATGQGFLGSALTGGFAQLGESVGKELFQKKFADSWLIKGLTQAANDEIHLRNYQGSKAEAKAHNLPLNEDTYKDSQYPFIPETNNHDVASTFGSVVGTVTGTGLGLIGSNVLRGMFDHSGPQEVVAASLIPIQQVPVAAQAQSPPEGVIALNAEQVKKAQQRAMEQAALNQYYAQQLAQYPVQ